MYVCVCICMCIYIYMYVCNLHKYIYMHIYLQSKVVIYCLALEGQLFFTAARPALHFFVSFACDTRVPSVYLMNIFPSVLYPLPPSIDPTSCPSPPTTPHPTYTCCIPTPFTCGWCRTDRRSSSGVRCFA